METYKIFVNTAGRFQPAEYLEIGEVEANSKKEAMEKAEYARKVGKSTEYVNFYFLMDGEERPFKI
jgi:hypothetical protein